MATTCHHRSVVARDRGQHPDQVRKGVHQALYAQTSTSRPPSWHSQGSALIQGKTMNFEAFDLADVTIIVNCWLNKLYFMQYYTESNINAENPDLTINKQ
jgi:hypothetical protein